MSDLGMPAPVIQMGLVEKLAEVQQNQSHVQQLVAQEMALQSLKADRERVLQTNGSEHGTKVRKRNEEQAKEQQQQASSDSSSKKQEEEDASEEGGAQASSPWVGQIVNMKV